MPKSADRLNKLPPYIFAVMGQRIQNMMAQGKDVISLDIGSPDLPPPPHVVDALINSAQNVSHHGYTGYRGIPTFRKAVATYYLRRFGISIDPEREVLPLIGSKEGIINLSLAYLDKGDYCLVPDISYPSYAIGAHIAGANVYWLPVSDSDSYVPDLMSVPGDIVAKARLLWLNFPNNPTGAIAVSDFYRIAIDFCIEHDILLAFDNPYVDVTYDNFVASSALQFNNAKQCTVEFISCSKTYNMGGWRLGAAVGNADALKVLLNMKSNVDSGHFRPIYDAGTLALEETPQSWIDQRNMVYQIRRDRILAVLPDIGLAAKKTKGSLYVWSQVIDGNGATYVNEALEGALVALAPGAAYGSGGDRYVRISLGVSDDRLNIALERLKAWYSSR